MGCVSFGEQPGAGAALQAGRGGGGVGRARRGGPRGHERRRRRPRRRLFALLGRPRPRPCTPLSSPPLPPAMGRDQFACAPEGPHRRACPQWDRSVKRRPVPRLGSADRVSLASRAPPPRPARASHTPHQSPGSGRASHSSHAGRAVACAPPPPPAQAPLLSRSPDSSLPLSSKTRGLGAGRKLRTHRRAQLWADKDYKKSHLGSEYKKPVRRPFFFWAGEGRERRRAAAAGGVRRLFTAPPAARPAGPRSTACLPRRRARGAGPLLWRFWMPANRRRHPRRQLRAVREREHADRFPKTHPLASSRSPPLTVRRRLPRQGHRPGEDVSSCPSKRKSSAREASSGGLPEAGSPKMHRPVPLPCSTSPLLPSPFPLPLPAALRPSSPTPPSGSAPASS